MGAELEVLDEELGVELDDEPSAELAAELEAELTAVLVWLTPPPQLLTAKATRLAAPMEVLVANGSLFGSASADSGTSVAVFDGFAASTTSLLCIGGP